MSGVMLVMAARYSKVVEGVTRREPKLGSEIRMAFTPREGVLVALHVIDSSVSPVDETAEEVPMCVHAASPSMTDGVSVTLKLIGSCTSRPTVTPAWPALGVTDSRTGAAAYEKTMEGSIRASPTFVPTRTATLPSAWLLVLQQNEEPREVWLA